MTIERDLGGAHGVNGLLFNAVVEHDAGLKLDVQIEIVGLEEIQHFGKRRDTHVAVALDAVVNVQFFQFRQRQILDHRVHAAGDSLDVFIMGDDDFAVLGEVNVQFDAVGLHFVGQGKGFQRVFRRVTRSAAVRPNVCHHQNTPFQRECVP